MNLKKITLLISSSILLNGCIETTALLGPAVTGGTSGNVYQASISFVSSETISKTTGKYPLQHFQKLVQTIEQSKINRSMNEVKKDLVRLNVNSKEFYKSVKKLYNKDKIN